MIVLRIRWNQQLLAFSFLLVFMFSGCKSFQLLESSEESSGNIDEVEERTQVEEIITEEVPDVFQEEIQPAPIPEKVRKDFPVADREFRAAWIATVANINWPSRPGLNSKDQQREAIEQLDFLKDHNFNAVVLQVRPQADAFYKSEIEPWSYYLTGEQGKAPEPFYDPLHFWIEAAHDRGIELHAWLNPYRAHHTTGKEISDQSVVKTNPELVVELANGMWWMDPSKKATQDYISAVVMDIVRRYDIDGIHFDDYFYPYASYNKGADFPDAAGYTAYKSNGGKLEVADWRRQGVNTVVERIYKEVKAEKPEVKFGISPFGIYRPGYPKTAKGMDQFSELYADARLWINEGWVDYYSPQLYWKIHQPGQSFPVLLDWWESENHKKRHLWPGIQIDFGGDDQNTIETISQIMITRGMLPGSMGTLHWNIGSLMKNATLTDAIAQGPYRKEALVPSSPWLDDEAPKAPVAVPEKNENTLKISWVPADTEDAFRYVVYYRYGATWNYKIMNRKDHLLEIPAFIETESSGKIPVKAIAVTAVDKTGNESEFKEIITGK